MYNKIEEFYLDLQNWIIQAIDADPEYYDYDNVEDYLNTKYPKEFKLYNALENYINNKGD